jgi:hypothetical protein
MYNLKKHLNIIWRRIDSFISISNIAKIHLLLKQLERSKISDGNPTFLVDFSELRIMLMS